MSTVEHAHDSAVTTTNPEAIFTEGRTVQQFSDQPVTDEELSRIWQLARNTPTMANSQPARVLFVRTPEGKERLLPNISDNNKEKVAAAPAVAIIAYDGEFQEFLPTTFPAAGERMKDLFSGNPELRESAARLSSALQAGGFIYAARAVGLDAAPLNAGNYAGIDAEFFAGTTWKSFLGIRLGHPAEAELPERLPRVPEQDAVAWA